MNTSTIRVLALFSLFAALGTQGAMAQSLATFTIPFSFTVGSKSFAAGDYRVAEVVPHVLQIQSRDSHTNMVVATFSEESGKLQGKASMSFHRYGDRYFLFKVSNQDRGWGLPPSVREKELIAAQVSAEPLGIIASSRK